MKIRTFSKGLALAGALGLAAVLPLAAVQAQEAPKEQRMEDVTWARVVMTRFLPGKRDRAIEIIRNYFAKADQMTGVKSGVHGVHFESGEWDMMYVFPMKGGTDDLMVLTSADEVKWMAEVAKLAGGQEAAEKLLAEYESLVALEVTQIAHAHKDH